MLVMMIIKVCKSLGPRVTAGIVSVVTLHPIIFFNSASVWLSEVFLGIAEFSIWFPSCFWQCHTCWPSSLSSWRIVTLSVILSDRVWLVLVWCFQCTISQFPGGWWVSTWFVPDFAVLFRPWRFSCVTIWRLHHHSRQYTLFFPAISSNIVIFCSFSSPSLTLTWKMTPV